MSTVSRYTRISVWIVAMAMLTVMAASAPASANVMILMKYKKAFPSMPPKCTYCHMEKMPRKAAGKHQLNAYGLQVKKRVKNNTVTVEQLQKLGNQEQFEKAHGGK